MRRPPPRRLRRTGTTAAISGVSKRRAPTQAWKRSPRTISRSAPWPGSAASWATSGPALPPGPLRWASAIRAMGMDEGRRWRLEDRQLGLALALPRDLRDDRLGDPAEGLGVRPLGLGDDDGNAAVAAADDFGVERDGAQEGGPQELGGPAAAALLEDVGHLAAVGADEGGHVLDDADHRHVDLLEHGEALPGVDEGDVLRCRHDHRPRELHLLGDRELRVAGAGGQVEDQVVECSPLDVAQHLLDRP